MLKMLLDSRDKSQVASIPIPDPIHPQSMESCLFFLRDLIKTIGSLIPDSDQLIKDQVFVALNKHSEIGVRFHGDGVAILNLEGAEEGRNKDGVCVRGNTGQIDQVKWCRIKEVLQ